MYLHILKVSSFNDQYFSHNHSRKLCGFTDSLTHSLMQLWIYKPCWSRELHVMSACNKPETVKHYFMECQLYTNQRLKLHHSIKATHPNVKITVDLLINGLASESVMTNIHLATNVQTYISETKCFI